MSLPIVERIRDVAKEHGWAIGEHGSMVRDIDLIAVPWTADATAPEVLVGAIVRVTGYNRHGVSLGQPRPGGRRSILLVHAEASFEHTPKGTWTPPAIDLSLMPSFAHCLSYVNGASNTLMDGSTRPHPEIDGAGPAQQSPTDGPLPQAGGNTGLPGQVDTP